MNPMFFILKGDPNLKGGHLPRGTKQMRGIARVGNHTRTYPKKSLKDAERFYQERLGQYAPEMPIETAVRLRVAYAYKIGKPKKVLWKITAPDEDNLTKVLKDEMTKAGFWKDDNLVVQTISGKYITNEEEAYIAVLIEDAGEPNPNVKEWNLC